jgi:hypothetical protein
VAALQHRHRLDARDGTGYSPAALRLAGIPFQIGRTYVERHTDRNTELVFQNNDLEKTEALEDLKLSDLAEPIVIPSEQSATLSLLVLGQPYSIEIGDNLYENESPFLPIDEVMEEIVDQINADYPGLATYFAGIDTLVLSWGDELEGVSIIPDPGSYQLIEERQLSQARIENLHAYIDSNPAPFRFPTVYAPQLYGGENPSFSGFVNWWLNDKYYEMEGYQGDPEWEVTYIPYVRLRWLLDQIAAAVGLVEISFDLPAAIVEEIDEMLIDNTYPIDQVVEEYVVTDGIGPRSRNGFASIIDLANHLPDWSAKELLTRLAQGLNCHFRFEDDRLVFVPNQRQATGEERDWTAYAVQSYFFEPKPSDGVLFSYATAEETLPADWEEDDDFALGAAQNPFTVTFRPLWNALRPNLLAPLQSTWRVAYHEEVGTSETFSTRSANSPLRLFVWRGVQQDLEGNTYRLGASDRANAAGDEIGELSLIWADGYFALFWRAWAEFMFTPIITRTCWLPLPELLRLRDFREPLVRIFHDNGESVALVRSVQVRISPQGLGAAKVEFQRRL